MVCKGLTGYVLRDAYLGDCTNGGISSRYDKLILIDRNNPDLGYVDVNTNNAPENAVEICSINVLGKTYYNVKPVKRGGKWFMAGGNFLWSSDSRFPADYPLPIHDRTE